MLGNTEKRHQRLREHGIQIDQVIKREVRRLRVLIRLRILNLPLKRHLKVNLYHHRKINLTQTSEVCDSTSQPLIAIDPTLIVSTATLLVVAVGVGVAWATAANARKTTVISFYIDISNRLDALWADLLVILEGSSGVEQRNIYPIFSHLESLSTLVVKNYIPRRIRLLVIEMVREHFDELIKIERARVYFEYRVGESPENFQDLKRLVDYSG